MFSHVTIGARDFARLSAFYDAVLTDLGLRRKSELEHEGWAGWGRPGEDHPQFWIGPPQNGLPATWGNGWMAAFLAPTRAAVDTWHAAVLANGGTCEGRPGLRPHYHPDFYGAYGRDVEGNKICAVCHDPE